MAKIFQSDIVITTSGEFVALRFVESINVNREEDDAIVQTLKNDIIVKIVTLSGKEYFISMQQQRLTFPKSITEQDNSDLVISIFEKWTHLLSVK